MKRLVIFFALILAAAAVGELWVLARGQLHERSCERYRAAIRVAVADPHSYAEVVWLSKEDKDNVIDSRNAFADDWNAARPRPNFHTFNPTEEERSAANRKKLLEAWEDYATKFEREALARKSCA